MTGASVLSGEIGLSDHSDQNWRNPILLPATLDDLDPEHLPQEFIAFADNLPTLCWLARWDGFIVWYNRRWHDYCGSTPAEMEGWGWQSVHDPVTLPTVMEKWTSCIEGGAPFEMVFPLRGADRILRLFLTRVIPVRDATGRIARWYGVNTDISGQVEAEAALLASEARFAALTDAMPQMVWSTLPDGRYDYYNAQWYAFTGVPAGSTDGKGWSDLFHPDDYEQASARWQHSLATGETYQSEYRLRHISGQYRWMLGRALPVRNAEGEITRWIGTSTEIHDAKQAAELNELLSRELSHRIKNIFAVISGLISFTGRKAIALRPVLNELMERVAALGRAHEFARPHSPASATTVAEGSLHGLMDKILKPYQSTLAGRITFTGDDVAIDDRGATPMALVLHELATNATKYGALSLNAGRVRIETAQIDDELSVCWIEEGGPVIAGPPQSRGFGTELAELSIERQLGGRIVKHWDPAGLRVELSVKASRLSR